MKKVILLMLILSMLLSLIGCNIAESDSNGTTNESTLDNGEKGVLYVIVLNQELYTFDLNTYKYVFGENTFAIRNRKTDEVWFFPYCAIQYIKVTE